MTALRRRRLAILVALALVVAACSTRMAYDNVHTLIAWRADDFLDLTAEQRDFIKQRVQYHQSWHRSQELQRYQSFIDATVAGVANGVTSAEIDQFLAQLIDFRAVLVDALYADVAQLLRTVDAEQLDNLRAALARANEELEELVALSPAERAEQRADRALNRIERWTGRLSREQRERIAREVSQLPDMTEAWLAYQRERQARFITLVERAREDPDFAQQLRVWLQERPGAPFAELQARVRDLVLVVDGLLTSAQRQHVLDELGELRLDIDSLRGA